MRHVVVGLLLILLQVASPVPRQAVSAHGEDKKSQKDNTAPNKPPTARPAEKPDDNTRQPKPQAEPGKATDIPVAVAPVKAQKDRWDYVYIFASLFIALTTMSLAVIAGIQAMAAKRQADHLMATEGAVLVPVMRQDHIVDLRAGDYTKLPYVQVACEITNHGRTPAWGVNAWAVYRSFACGSDLPKIPEYSFPNEATVKPMGQLVLKTGDSVVLTLQISGAQFEIAWREKRLFYVYGKVIYRDIFSRDRVMGFCFRLDGYDFRLGGPAAYNYNT
jgi:hypothetical protein